MKTVCLWSAGKDSCFACYKALASGYEIVSLLHFADSQKNGSLGHGLSQELVEDQSEAIGIPLLCRVVSEMNYRAEFLKTIAELKLEQGIQGIIFGDIYLQEHRDWIESVCLEASVEAVFPLWGKSTSQLAEEIISCGFKAMIVAVEKSSLGDKWLGKIFDREFIHELPQKIDPCGEKGEFHTFVYDGPFFKRPVKFLTGQKFFRDKNAFLHLSLPGKRGDANE